MSFPPSGRGPRSTNCLREKIDPVRGKDRPRRSPHFLPSERKQELTSPEEEAPASMRRETEEGRSGKDVPGSIFYTNAPRSRDEQGWGTSFQTVTKNPRRTNCILEKIDPVSWKRSTPKRQQAYSLREEASGSNRLTSSARGSMRRAIAGEGLRRSRWRVDLFQAVLCPHSVQPGKLTKAPCRRRWGPSVLPWRSSSPSSSCSRPPQSSAT
jgi:hypothetical protein